MISSIIDGLLHGHRPFIDWIDTSVDLIISFPVQLVIQVDTQNLSIDYLDLQVYQTLTKKKK